MKGSEYHPTFSQREKIESQEKELQYKSIDDDLKHGIWNVIFQCYLDVDKLPSTILIQDNAELKNFFEIVLYDFFKVPADTIINGYLSTAIEEIRELYYDLKWNQIYDFIEFLVCNVPHDTKKKNVNLSFVESCNKVLIRENSGYRFVDDKIIKTHQQN